MSVYDYSIFFFYLVFVVCLGLYFYKKNSSKEDFFVGNRSIKSSHIGFSIAATDVGGGFSIGLGGLGYAIGLSGSWLLFTGLLGAWLTAVYWVPKVKAFDTKHQLFTFPELFAHRYNSKVAVFASFITAIGYLGFTSGQILAGAKLLEGTFSVPEIFGLDSRSLCLIGIGVLVILYTTLGGLKAVIYTDTIQWIVLLLGIICFAIPISLMEIGGFDGLVSHLPNSYFSFTEVSFPTLLNWAVTIIPIWFVAMTLYQRMYAVASVKEAKKAWYIAGFFEYPVMAFSGVLMGMIAHVLVPGVESEMGVPLLLKTVLPVGIAGLVVGSYFSAIMSTADSCVIASSGTLVHDILEKLKRFKSVSPIRLSQMTTLIIGLLAIVLAMFFTQVLDAILYVYTFMVAGLLVPTIGIFYWKNGTDNAAYLSMWSGGGLSVFLLLSKMSLPYDLNPTVLGLLVSFLVFHGVTKLETKGNQNVYEG